VSTIKINLIKQITSAVSAFALVLVTVAPVGATVSGSASNTNTGAESVNTSEVVVLQETTLVQENDAHIDNNVSLNMTTGGNQAIGNNGAGDVTSGDVFSGVAISNSANTNVAEVDSCGGCDMDLEVSNDKTGYGSVNEAGIGVEKTTELFQSNKAKIDNDVDVESHTGGNVANYNNDDSEVVSGNVDGTVIVQNAANQNVAATGGGSGSASLSASNSNTGAFSLTSAVIEARMQNLVSQENYANVDNDVELDFTTGGNQAIGNNGSGDVTSGDIDAGVALDTMTNSNFLAFDGCCDIEFETANDKTGFGSYNSSAAALLSAHAAFQDNDSDTDNDVDGELHTGNNFTSYNNEDANESGEIGAIVQVETDSNHNSLGDLEMNVNSSSMSWWGFWMSMMN
jgi:hypothetical protein